MKRNPDDAARGSANETMEGNGVIRSTGSGGDGDLDRFIEQNHSFPLKDPLPHGFTYALAASGCYSTEACLADAAVRDLRARLIAVAAFLPSCVPFAVASTCSR